MARAAVRPAAPVRLGRGGEPPGLISPSGVFPSPEIDKLLLWTDMSNPDDDTDVPSGFNDDAEMERTSPRASETAIACCPLTSPFGRLSVFLFRLFLCRQNLPSAHTPLC